MSVRRVSLKLASRWVVASSSDVTGKASSESLVVNLEDESGLRGIGESAPSNRYRETTRSAAAFLSKVNPERLSFSDVSGAMRYVDGLDVGELSAKAAINIALLDGSARSESRALYDFLGLGFREHRHVTSFSIGMDPPDIVYEKVLAASQYPVLKLKLGGPGDQATLAALRNASPNKWVRVDANEAWKTKEKALRCIEQIAGDQRIQFVEQPMPATTPSADWAWLKAHSPIPIFADESYHTADDAPIAAECFHGVNVKLCKTGGITQAIAALRAARAAGLKTMVGCMIETSILTSAAAHLAELCDYLDIDGNLLITNDPYAGVTADNGVLSFSSSEEKFGLRVIKRQAKSAISGKAEEKFCDPLQAD